MIRSYLTMIVAGMAAFQTAFGNVSIEIGKTTGSGSASLTAATFNFGVTSAAQQISISNLKVALARGQSATQPVIIEIFDGLGGTGTVVQRLEIPANSISQGNMTYQTLSFGEPFILGQGAYSVRISTSAPAGNSGYTFRPAILTLGDSGGVTLNTSQWIQDNNDTGTAGSTLAPVDGYILADGRASETSI